MSLLTVVNSAQRRLTLPTSASVAGTSDETARLFLELANEVGKALYRRFPWQILRLEHTWSATATEEQASGLPEGYGSMVQRTFYNRSRKRRVLGPYTAQAWQYQKSVTAQVVYDSFTIRGGQLLIIPTPTLGDTYAFEYISEYWVTSDVDADAYRLDTDISKIDEELITLGIIWRFKKSKGFDYAEDFNEFEMEVKKAMAADGGGGQTIDAAGCFDPDAPREPGVPEGSWIV